MKITKVDFRGLEPSSPGWAEARAAVTASMVAQGFVVVRHNGLGSERREALFGCAMPEVFALPVEAKQRSHPASGPYRAYISDVPGMDWESMGVGTGDEIGEPFDAGSVSKYTHLLWPQGNPAFW
jgi:isopenicillin N synthase-like dioxygenase